MVAEDFAVFNTLAPTFFARVGTASREIEENGKQKKSYPLHNENSLAVSVALFVEFTHQYLGK